MARRDEIIDTESETRVLERDRRGPRSWGAGTWVVLALLLGLVIVLLAIWATDDGVDTAVQDVDVVQDDDAAGDAAADEGGTGSGDAAAGGGTEVLRIEPAGDATADADIGDVIVQQPRADGAGGQVDVTLAERSQLEAFDGATFTVPTGEQVTLTIENDTDQAWNAYLEAEAFEVSTDLASMEPAIEAGGTREFEFTAPDAPGSYSLRVETPDGETVMEASIELE